MRIVDRIPTSFSGIKVPSGNYCLAKSKELAAKEFTDYGARITEYFDLMVNQIFLPNYL